MNPARLEGLFRYYNRRYWRGRLPEYQISFEPLPSYEDGEIVAWCDKPNQTLRFDPAKIKNDRQWRITLLHELCHILSEPGHYGKDFMDQLFFRCPKYVGLAECFGNKDFFTAIKYGPRRAHRVYKRLGW
jgi:hypothetical protein